MFVYVPFYAGATIFSALNAAGSVGCWYLTRRSIMLWTGMINTGIGAAAAALHKWDVKLANVYACTAATCAAGQYTLHAMRTPQLLRPTLASYVYLSWIIGLLTYAAYRARWVYELRHE